MATTTSAAAFAPTSEECYALNADGRRARDAMDSYLDMLFDSLKPLEGRVIPRGWSASLVAGSVVGFGLLLAVLAFLLI